MQQYGMKRYLVGGAVRDLLLGRLPDELDYAFEGSSEAFIQANPGARKVGRSVSVVLLDNTEYMPLAEGDPAHDLLFRDLTINAFVLDEGGRLHTHPSALHDLRAGVLRLAAPDALRRDPLRVFRLARFAAQFPDFSLHASAIAAAREIGTGALLQTLPAERVGRELRKAFSAPRPSRFLHALSLCRCLHPWLQECVDMDKIPAGPPQFHRGTVLEHTALLMDALAGDPLAVWMAFTHDLGKMRTPPDMLPHHYGHEKRGRETALCAARRLRLPRRFEQAGLIAAELHMQAGIYPILRTGTKRDLLMRVHQANLDLPFWKLVSADSGRDRLNPALRDLNLLLAVKLPEQQRGKGKESGTRLRLLQCEALHRTYQVQPPAYLE